METTSRTPETVTLREDVPAPATGTVRRAASSVRESGRQQVARVQESVRRQPRRWAGASTGVVALVAAVAGAVVWQRNRRQPVGRGARAWQAVTSRFGR
jgi:hypothetical protein